MKPKNLFKKKKRDIVAEAIDSYMKWKASAFTRVLFEIPLMLGFRSVQF